VQSRKIGGGTGNEPKNYDFEIWDERYQPESPDNEIDLYIALK
jgi:AraC family transcriptional regulator